MARLIGINHVALEVGDIDEALRWYGRFFEFELRGRGRSMAFIDMGDQFIALSARPTAGTRAPAGAGHFGLVVEDQEQVRTAMQQAGIAVSPSGSLDFHDPWGNHVQVVDYREVQFTKAPGVLRGMGFDTLVKSESAQRELRDKGLAD
jgi:lactoylglutathione lyase